MGPIQELVSKDKVYEWTEKQQKAFDAIKDKLARDPVTAYPDETKPYHLFVDASDYGIGIALMQWTDIDRGLWIKEKAIVKKKDKGQEEHDYR